MFGDIIFVWWYDLKGLTPRLYWVDDSLDKITSQDKPTMFTKCFHEITKGGLGVWCDVITLIQDNNLVILESHSGGEGLNFSSNGIQIVFIRRVNI